MGNTFLNSVLLIIFHFSVATFSMNLTSILTDQSALLALKDLVTHDSKNILATNWPASTAVCNWFGVRCGSRHNRVTTLNLSGLPVRLSNLRRLKHIDFDNNSFIGEIPSWFGSLTELRELYLHVNNFSGIIPSSLGYLPKLEKLSLYENQISGSIPSLHLQYIFVARY
ncbi:leucine-rich repeat receptor-like serine/threonine-protein kinase BAM2 [Hibiscus syriacus]|uniref:leucine-rich repeat receptor-like serine/threonine-protein kinase BAM2 n=1 Tax=Hibiscus syriacus TaxID=106335 RepID=UPI0019226C8A|nr:leucine-rich repeat receptor-like serine/threonine-protein kinase BAM2 [Hibiscus syriacus]